MLRYWLGCVLGWLSFALCVVLLAKFIGRVSKVKAINNVLHVLHKPFGIAVILTGLIHGLYLIIKHPHALAGNITGAFLMAAIIILMITYLLRKKMKAKWFLAHRILSVLLVALLIVHIVVVNVCGHNQMGKGRHNGEENAVQSVRVYNDCINCGFNGTYEFV